MAASEKVLTDLPRIGPSLAKSLKEQTGGSVGNGMPEPEWVPDDDDIEAMAAEYEGGGKTAKQSNLLDF
jgi:hypothetical protein